MAAPTKRISLAKIHSSPEDITLKAYEEKLYVPFMKEHFIGWRKIHIEDIRPDPTSPHVAERYAEPEYKFLKLVSSMKRFGISEDIIVSETGSGDYLIIKGVRRFRAAMRLGTKKLVCLVYSPLSPEDRETLRVKIYNQGLQLMKAARRKLRLNHQLRAATRRITAA